MKVLKFGGSVLKNFHDIENIKFILDKTLQTYKNGKPDKILIVFSAFYGITNQLLNMINTAVNSKQYLTKLDEIRQYHYTIADNLEILSSIKQEIDEYFLKLQHLLLIVNDFKKADNEAKDYVISFGEQLSSLIIAKFLSKYYDVYHLKSQNVIKTDSNFGYAKIDVYRTETLIQEYCLSRKETIIVCAGFIGSNNENKITTLGRNGSDYSAAIMASALNAECLEIWKDIDGLYTADPKIVKNVKFIKKISYQEMAELSSLGNKVLHVNAIFPCITKKIPIFLKNCYNVDSIGTMICSNAYDNYLINGIVKLDNVAIVKIRMNEFADMEKIAIKLQKIIQRFESSIITVSQNFKQKVYSIIAVSTDVQNLCKEFQTAFEPSIKSNDITFEVSEEKSMISVIGSDLSNSVGIAGRIFNLIQQKNVNIDAIHDDFSKTRISFLCNVSDAENVINFLHQDLVINGVS